MSIYKGGKLIAGDGVNPTVSLTKKDGVTTLSITDIHGTKTVEILDGVNAGDAAMAVEERLEKHMLGGI